jgi:predicted  nucleic acid-binding Zn-ribbon protein
MAQQVPEIINELEQNLKKYDGDMNIFYVSALEKIETIKGLIGQIRTMVDNFNVTKDELAKCKANEAVLQSQLGELQAQVNRLRDANQNLREEQNANEQMQEQLKTLQDELSRLQKEKADLEEELGMTKTENDRKGEQIQKYQAEIDGKNNELTTINEQLENNKRTINDLAADIETLQERINEEDGKEKELQDKLAGYNTKIEQLNVILQRLLVDGRSEEVQRGLDEIIGLLGGISGGPGAGGRIGDNLNNGAPLPAIVDNIPNATQNPMEQGRISTIPLHKSAEKIAAGDEDDSSVISASTLGTRGSTANPLHHTAHVPHVVKAYYKNDEVEFKIPGAKSDRDARNAKIRNIINVNFGTYRDSIFKDGNKVNINETIMGRSNPYIDPADFMNIRKKIRSELNTWQESYEGVDKNYPFKGIYGESSEKPDKFSIEFPYHSSKNYKLLSSFGHGHSNSSGRKGGKKTRRKKGIKSKNKTIKYKRNKNKKQSKKK